MMTGMCWVRGSAFNRRQTSKPSMPGIITSSRMTSARSRGADMQRLRTAPRGSHLEILGRQPRLEQLHVGVDVVNHKHAGGHELLPCYRATPMNWRTVSRNMATEMGLEI